MAHKSTLTPLQDPLVFSTLPLVAVSVVWFLAGEELAGTAASVAGGLSAIRQQRSSHGSSLWVWAAGTSGVFAFLCALDAVMRAQLCADDVARTLLLCTLFAAALTGGFHARAVKARLGGEEGQSHEDQISFYVMAGVTQTWAAVYTLYCKSFTLIVC